MPLFSRLKTWASGEVLTAATLNAEFNNIINNMSPTGIEDASSNVSNMQSTADPGGVGTESLATDLLGEIKRLRFALKRIVGAQWYSTPLFTLDTQIVAASIASNAVTTAKIQDGAVTSAKLASLNYGLSSSSTGTFSGTSSGAYAAVTNATVTITTTGRPVLITLVPDGTNTENYLAADDSANSDVNAGFALYKDGNAIGSQIIRNYVSTGGTVASIKVPVSTLTFFDTPTAASHTYALYYKSGSATITTSVYKAKLLVREL